MIKKKKISEEDLNTWQNYLKNPTDLTDKDRLKKKNEFNKRYKYDLHGHTLIEANESVKKIILSCIQDKYKEILLITGKGIHSNTEKDIYVSRDLSKLRYSIPEYIKSNQDLSKFILSIDRAEKKDGGDGAIIIKLKNL
ncbi:Smr/MutS family protein [Pelagibacteraceae bacterium]|nr:Smr/MutS family protein [Pelagibacteraceae bacterium]